MGKIVINYKATSAVPFLSGKQIRWLFGYNLEIIILYFSIKTSAVGTHLSTREAILMSIHNIFFMENCRNFFINYHQISTLSVSLSLSRAC